MTKPKRSDLASPQVRAFRERLKLALDHPDADGRRIGDAKWGVYAFYDFDMEPIYVGQTNERLRTRVGRHLTNQRSDAVAMRVLDIFEVRAMQLWPLWDLQEVAGSDPVATARLNQVEYSAYAHAIERSRFRTILNEKIPPVTEVAELAETPVFQLVDKHPLDERWHPDVRIARRAETISRLAAVARERGEVSAGLRRVLVIQAVRLTYLSAFRYAEAVGNPPPGPAAIDLEALVGNLLVELGDDVGSGA